ncbi:MAG: UDP-glucose--hexose-1-phosphate uridylyltransferase [Clostridia bacterium]|nr:UDP-glucose--hexose-1-phosphate uridylyltransferase [Clostridia bacterium]
MSNNIYTSIKRLVRYAEDNGLIESADREYSVNRLLEVLCIDNYEDVDDASLPAPKELPEQELDEILSELCRYAFDKGLIDGDGTDYFDLFDTKLMGVLTPRPSEVISRFQELYALSPEKATDYFYDISRKSNYIRVGRVKKDLRWSVPSEYGDIDISINLSKPEKDPKAIAAAKLLPQAGYPKCLLCPQNEGYAGRLNHPARQNLRLIPVTIDGCSWFVQYSPYVYYNEHCIVLNAVHTPMVINRSSFAKLLDLVEYLPHYFVGSNADLPIVGGSILSHDHMQGGRYTFAMEKAPVEKKLVFNGFSDVESGIVKWPMSVIRLRGESKERLVELADKILVAWRGYTDEEAFIFAETDGEPHNTITPIARRRGSDFELDLVLRNNITTEEHPMGVYHPHAELHNIKKENIGLIEVMGLAVLPARLKSEMELLGKLIVSGGDITGNEITAKHYEWYKAFAHNYEFTEENVDGILKEEIGRTFVKVLEDAGVYKRTSEGISAFMRFCDSVK